MAKTNITGLLSTKIDLVTIQTNPDTLTEPGFYFVNFNRNSKQYTGWLFVVRGADGPNHIAQQFLYYASSAYYFRDGFITPDGNVAWNSEDFIAVP